MQCSFVCMPKVSHALSRLSVYVTANMVLITLIYIMPYTDKCLKALDKSSIANNRLVYV